MFLFALLVTTRCNTEYRIMTKGIMVPHVESTSMGLKLGLTAAIPDKAVGEEVGTCVYTLFSAASGTTSSFVFYGVKS